MCSKVTNKNTKTTSLIKTRSGVFIVNFEHFFTSSSGVSIVDFEQVNVCWYVNNKCRRI